MKERLVARGMHLDDTCPLCHLATENISHAIRDCSEVKPIWYQLGIDNNNRTFFSLNINDWLTSNAKSKRTPSNHPPWSTTFLFAIWLIWQQRNHVVFRGKRANPQLAKAIVAQAMEYTLCINRPNCNQPWVSKQISWERPDRGWFKLNTDGAASGPTNRASCGGLIRNDQGNWLMGFSRNIGQANSFMAECWALRDGLLLCLQQNLQNIVIELDASALVAALNSPMYVNAVVSPLFDDCRQLVGQFSRCCIRHIDRKSTRLNSSHNQRSRMPSSA